MEECREELNKIKNETIKKYLLRQLDLCEMMTLPNGLLEEIVKEAHNKPLLELTSEELRYQLKIAYTISLQNIAFVKELVSIIKEMKIKGDK